MFRLPPWIEVPFAALIYVGPLLLLVAVVLLAVPDYRRDARVRRLAYWLLSALGSVLFICGLTAGALVLGTMPNQPTTHHVRAAEMLGGILFPAGSTVRVWSSDGSLDSGSVPSTTVIDGLPLIGAFHPMGSNADHVLDGTLASAITVIGVPCAAGPVRFWGDIVRCVLARDFAFEGHLLAAGQLIELWSGTGPVAPHSDEAPPQLRFGVLAGVEALFGTVWPAGTVVGGITAPPEAMTGRPSGEVVFCLPAGKTADIGVATLHGPIAYAVRDDYLRVLSRCELLPELGTGTEGYAQVGADRFHIGSRSDGGSPWDWSTDPHW